MSSQLKSATKTKIISFRTFYFILRQFGLLVGLTLESLEWLCMFELIWGERIKFEKKLLK